MINENLSGDILQRCLENGGWNCCCSTICAAKVINSSVNILAIFS